MEGKFLIESKSCKTLKRIFFISSIILLLSAIILFFIGISYGKNEWAADAVNWSREYYHGTYYKCLFCGEITSHENIMFSHMLKAHSDKTYIFDYGIAFFIIHWAVILFAGILLLIYFLLTRCKVSITDKNVYGRTFWGKKVVLPLYMVSAYSTSKIFAVLAIATSSGYIKFPCIGNREEIANVLQQLINERQLNTENQATAEKSAQNNSNNLDDLIKLKSLLDNGIITQEEFDIKKKELLGL